MKTIVITGGNKGLGLAQTQRFLSDHRVVVIARSKGELDTLPHQENLEFVEQDLSQWRDTQWLDSVYEKWGPIGGLVNNAGMHLKKPVWEVSGDELENVLDLNVKAMFTACGRYVALHEEHGGAIVNLSSMGGLMALAGAAAYVTAKTAVIGLTRSIAVDAASRNIRCNAVCPGFIETNMTRAILAKDPARRDKIEGRIPSGQFGTPADIADAIHFLLGDNARYVNGIALPVDGGYSIGF
ncbi:SDR family NAD(P)-dependent oxidoreductase [Granulosicoccus antarcticus]|uniref:2-(R)-hydroxypropyl-CoM dehydrogenase n=1 Tax=Granulosicoccus antarcticus IMCC3135 TaxID=1192854 RepID=A0A2Z2P4C3_9GAMM|nr:SDR family oxidoreductase [Granulosicoccus antarcticus]ASJ76280.1 2-(R)-hydroxypropyl-CoM dehydrogenase [Granulosicoccus antarcticus IMCC3135]